MKVLIDNPSDIDIPSALSILSLQSGSSQYELKQDRSGIQSKGAVFPSAWLTVLLLLLLCNQVSADEVYRVNSQALKQEDTLAMGGRLDKDSMRQLIDELNMTGLEAGATMAPLPQLQAMGWQLALDRVELGGVGSDSAVLSQINGSGHGSGFGYGYDDLLSQDSRLYSGWGAGVGYRFELEPGLSAVVKLGALSWELESAPATGYEQASESDFDGVSPYLGLGLNFRLSPETDVRFQWDHFELNERGFDVVGIKLEYRF
ncbi:outer membrane beta-barrel protein [uncultured Shewanella sp.]|uniref:outer membrane beta-barrel protein n=1 Tax=Shewanella atlantica TaxID=271099 RepID=UPI002614A683|nr:outer membrane beta-barrel protein [uncultured Shewanella sp.]